VVADLIEAARGLRAGISGRVTSGVGPRGASTPARLRPSSSVSAWYVRLQVEEKPGVLADITRIVARNGVSLATVLQRETGRGSSGTVPVVLTTHPTSAGAMARALRRIGALRALRGSPNVVRIEQL
jgi:homoserine dehydrogenase